MSWRSIMTSLAAILAGCSPLGVVNAFVPADGFRLTADVPYGGSVRQRLDVYQPRAASSEAPVIVFFHGGAWQGGDKGDYRFVGQALTSQGLVAVIPEYRTYPEVRFPAFVDDGAAAVRWVRDNVSRFGGDGERIYLMGHSAGAHIATLLALEELYLARVDVDAHRLRGVIGLAGPYDFLPIRDSILQEIFGPREGWAASQPVRFVDGDEAPMLLLHGNADVVVLPRNTIRLAARIRERGGRVTDVLYRGMGHARILAALAPGLRRLSPVLRDAIEFIRENEDGHAGR